MSLSADQFERLRLTAKKCDHRQMQPEVLFDIASDLKNHKGRGGRLFEKRRARADKFVNENFSLTYVPADNRDDLDNIVTEHAPEPELTEPEREQILHQYMTGPRKVEIIPPNVDKNFNRSARGWEGNGDFIGEPKMRHVAAPKNPWNSQPNYNNHAKPFQAASPAPSVRDDSPRQHAPAQAPPPPQQAFRPGPGTKVYLRRPRKGVRRPTGEEYEWRAMDCPAALAYADHLDYEELNDLLTDAAIRDMRREAADHLHHTLPRNFKPQQRMYYPQEIPQQRMYYPQEMPQQRTDYPKDMPQQRMDYPKEMPAPFVPHRMQPPTFSPSRVQTGVPTPFVPHPVPKAAQQMAPAHSAPQAAPRGVAQGVPTPFVSEEEIPTPFAPGEYESLYKPSTGYNYVPVYNTPNDVTAQRSSEVKVVESNDVTSASLSAWKPMYQQPIIPGTDL